MCSKCCRKRAAARQYSPVSHGSDTERSALLRRAERAEALVQDQERLGKKSNKEKETQKKNSGSGGNRYHYRLLIIPVFEHLYSVPLPV
ncbi:hypothetical protein AOXY_G6251 [Acipenser oxyrinchus oxyrinchus]|uniref:Uncharacterized protein n=1 Tax=Acipenser oxyrinchus oxyrinchus TaxID=40147 RepID=A0AAD8LM80_ACIOX|nr:hypothetical protein AOXY_G6251 [Acipenser oxyrinchus oxyrinchus]